METHLHKNNDKTETLNLRRILNIRKKGLLCVLQTLKYNECIIKSLYVRTSPMQICEVLHIFLAYPEDFLIFVFLKQSQCIYIYRYFSIYNLTFPEYLINTIPHPRRIYTHTHTDRENEKLPPNNPSYYHR